MKPSKDISTLIEIMKDLRTPVSGCPWDLEQNFKSIAPYTIEEAYEVADAIEKGDMEDLKEELGDLLLQVVYHARMAEEVSHFNFGDVVEAICHKMIRRHPHVYGDEKARNTGMAKGVWDQIKQKEREERNTRRMAQGAVEASSYHLDSIPSLFPALVEAEKLQQRAALVGFDWGATAPVLDKVHEEVRELSEEVFSDEIDLDRVEDELGDVLFAVTNLARHLGVSPEQALKRSNRKFRYRFQCIEKGAHKEGRPLDDLTLDEMEAFWVQAKHASK
ncbi:nucleoside triphosphate pyrophosphohydrolase [Flexibacterium corallicola]|uniref:nucleoside triphosphate pyrophosphohydrolase n=1 Tax=Flexibacterium corallicola TaxID=3037259 RepID=UPI00286FA5B4|nr:nucleoside triphosphate pyrophosphohydrolase [Pseudovibrio sp. M1P-2-3]